MSAKLKTIAKPTKQLSKPTAQAGPVSAELLALQALPADEMLQLWEHLQAWVKTRQPLLPPLARLGTQAGLTRAQATALLLGGTGYRAARSAERLHALHLVLKPHSYTPLKYG
jgi:hypothetical protein